MLTTQAKLAIKNHEPVRFLGDLYNIEYLEKTSSNGNRPVAMIKKIARRQYDGIEVDIMNLEKLSEDELEVYRERTEKA